MCEMFRKAENARQKMNSSSRNSWMLILLQFITYTYLHVFFRMFQICYNFLKCKHK